MEIKVGDYVRTKNGIIGKIESKNFIGYSDWIIDTLYYNDDEIIDNWTCGVKEYDILKSSPNIIDLIEVGDYVNGQLVMEIYEKNSIYNGSLDYKFKERTLELFNTDYECIPHEFLINNKRIESILTKEQFAQMEYKIHD